MVRPHGNSKTGKPYRRTRESTKSLLRAELKHSSPKEAVNKVFEKKGGVLKAESAGELPRSRDQAYKIKRKQQEELATSMGLKPYPYATKDVLYVVMEQCKRAEKEDILAVCSSRRDPNDVIIYYVIIVYE